MQPYQAWRRGLISYQMYVQNRLSNEVNLTDTSTTSTMFLGQMSIQDNEVWTVQSDETTLGFIGATNDLTIDGTANLNGDSLFYTAGKGITVTSSGTINLRGSLTVKPY
jgi:hypothetical protein